MNWTTTTWDAASEIPDWEFDYKLFMAAHGMDFWALDHERIANIFRSDGYTVFRVERPSYCWGGRAAVVQFNDVEARVAEVHPNAAGAVGTIRPEGAPHRPRVADAARATRQPPSRIPHRNRAVP